MGGVLKKNFIIAVVIGADLIFIETTPYAWLSHTSVMQKNPFDKRTEKDVAFFIAYIDNIIIRDIV